jgi:hypothetical protein
MISPINPRAKYAPFDRIWHFDAPRIWHPAGLETALLANTLMADYRRKNSIASRRAGRQVALTRVGRVLTFRSKIDCSFQRRCREDDPASDCCFEPVDCNSDFCSKLTRDSVGASRQCFGYFCERNFSIHHCRLWKELTIWFRAQPSRGLASRIQLAERRAPRRR